MKFTPEQLLSALSDFGTVPAYWVAYSGGLDSHVLLHAMAGLRERLHAPVKAVHVNHGLSPRAAEWADHCRRVCRELNIELDCFEIDATAPKGTSREAWSRQRRYEVLGQRLGHGELLLTAHQADDQAETLLLQLLRGGGPAGLAAMPAVRALAAGGHARPLLAFDRSSLHAYAIDNALSWLEDDSNKDQGFDRNFIRYSLMPVIKQRWPAATATLGRAAAIQAETAELLRQLADADLQEGDEPGWGPLPTAALQAMPPARQRNMLRRWLQRGGTRAPDSRRLNAIIEEVVNARRDAEPCVAWEGVAIRRFRGRLFVLSPLPEIAVEERLAWDMQKPLRLPLGELSSERVIGAGLNMAACGESLVRVGFRQGGEVIKWPDSAHHRALKKLFQEHHIPPWMRPYIPLLFIDDILVSVAGVWTDEDYLAGPNEPGLRIRWTQAGEVFGVE